MRCTHWCQVPLDLTQEARERSASGCVDGAVQCQLAAHDDDEHYGLLDDLARDTALWLRWHGRSGVEMVVLPDCPVVGPGPDGEGCCLFIGHAEQHSWEDHVEEDSYTG